jgi:hypothetical protein
LRVFIVLVQNDSSEELTDAEAKLANKDGVKDAAAELSEMTVDGKTATLPGLGGLLSLPGKF